MNKLGYIKLLTVGAVLTLCVNAHASEGYLEKFARAMGLYEQIDAQIAMVDAQGRQLATQYSKQLLSSGLELSESSRAELSTAYESFVSNELPALINSDETVAVYLDLISAKMSKEEIEAVTTFYESELGKKFTQENAMAMSEWSETLMLDVNTKMAAALSKHSEELVEIATRK